MKWRVFHSVGPNDDGFTEWVEQPDEFETEMLTYLRDSDHQRLGEMCGPGLFLLVPATGSGSAQEFSLRARTQYIEAEPVEGAPA